MKDTTRAVVQMSDAAIRLIQEWETLGARRRTSGAQGNSAAFQPLRLRRTLRPPAAEDFLEGFQSAHLPRHAGQWGAGRYLVEPEGHEWTIRLC